MVACASVLPWQGLLCPTSESNCSNCRRYHRDSVLQNWIRFSRTGTTTFRCRPSVNNLESFRYTDFMFHELAEILAAVMVRKVQVRL